MILIRKSNKLDLDRLYEIGKSFPELTVSDGEFMDKRDFEYAMFRKDGHLVLAEDSLSSRRIVGFAYAAREAPTYAALYYVAVTPEYRNQGIGSNLVKECMKRMKEIGVESIYCLATNDEAINAMKKLGFKEGKKLTWMDMDI